MQEKMIDIIKSVLEESPKRNFLESVEIAVNLRDVDMNLPKNRIDEEVLLPKGRGKKQKIAVFGSDELAVKAKECADTV
ncbi:MAG TPA: 50S ribosomal protein L1, partial [Thermoplasmata archaeon]|nr:50S ribosomal protein L1 [Thermoplasmata archaeon]